MEIIHDLLWLWVLGAVGGTGYILWAILVRDAKPAPQVVTTRRVPSRVPPPVARPAGTPTPPVRTPVPPSSTPEYQRRGSAPTVKLPTQEPAKPSADEAAAADLFGGLAEARVRADSAPAPAPAAAPVAKEPPKDTTEKAGRIEDYGFHIGSKAAESSTRSAADPVIAEAAAQPRSQTQELDDILKRIDAVLSETDAPAAEATMTDQQKQSSAGQATMPVSLAPPVEKASDRKDTDPNQQKLF